MPRKQPGLVELPKDQPDEPTESAAAPLGATEPNDVQAAPSTPPQSRRYLVRLKYSPDAIVAAQHPAEAQAKYMARMNLIGTIHPFSITDVTDSDELPDPQPEKPAPPPAVRVPILID